MIYLSASLFVIACIFYAGYSFLSIRGLTSGWGWHVLQYLSAGTFFVGGFLLGRVDGFGWHAWGNFAAVAVLGVSAYIIVLRILQRKF